jgi:hypothetical protein
MVKFDVISEIRNIETIASGSGVYLKRYLERTYSKGRWRKMKGFATIRFADGRINDAEIHWYEAHGVGRKAFKIKRILR